MRNNRYRLSDKEIDTLMASRESEANQESRVLIIGDTHCPFDLDTYLDFLVDTYKKYNCNKVIHIGDELDHHYSSYHETDANGMGGGEELEFAINRLARYYKEFPDVDVIIGNHSRLIMRKAQSGGIPKEWMRDYNDVLQVRVGKKPAISCGVVIGGKEAIVVPMKLEEYKDGTKYPQI